ncbi:MAG: signal peptidase I, partial [Nitrososphaerales archaeon]
MEPELARTLDAAPSLLRILDGDLDADALFKEARRRRRLRWLIGILHAAVILGVVVAIGTAYGFGGGTTPGPHPAAGAASPAGFVYTVEATSMEPTLIPGEQVEVTRVPGGLKRGDLVDFTLPSHFQTRGNDTMIKRIIGLPGETISWSGSHVLINGTPLSEPYLKQDDTLGPTLSSQVIPPGEYFVLSDNRTDSLDSSYFGPLPATSILGIA